MRLLHGDQAAAMLINDEMQLNGLGSDDDDDDDEAAKKAMIA